MNFPNEIIDLIVSQGLDSCRTSISWSQIRQHYRELIRSQVGVLVLQDGSTEMKDIQPLIDYKILMNEKNTFHLVADHPQYDALRQFIVDYTNLLVVIHSDRSYNDVLASILNDIAQNTRPGTKLCIIYSNSLNFLSKLYFRELSLFQEKIQLCELHVLGNETMTKDEICDLNTLFERTYLYNLKSIYSLDVQSTSHQLISRDLDTIKQLNFTEYDEASSDFFAHCPNLRVIESMKFPIGLNDTPFRLPRCDFITLTHYVDGCHYPPINGEQVLGELCLFPSLRSGDPQFFDLHFPNLKKLTLRLNDAVGHLVRFVNCDFSTLESINCGSCIVPWSDLGSPCKSLRSVAVTLTSTDQLQWLVSCPLWITSLFVCSPRSRISDFPVCDLFEETKLKFSRVEIQIQHLWQCYILQNLILPNLTPSHSLKVVFDESALMDSIASNPDMLKRCKLTYGEECIIFRIPFLKEFTLIEVGHTKHEQTRNIPVMKMSSIEVNQMSSPAGYKNVFFDIDASHDMNYAVSPTEFRRNSLAGATSQSARRQSAIVFHNGTRERRASSLTSSNTSPPIHSPPDDPFEGEAAIFECSESCPSVLTTNLSAIESSLFSWQKIRSNRIPLLRVMVEDLCTLERIDDVNYIIPKLSAQIMELLKYPYDMRFPVMIIEKFQVVVDFSLLNIPITNEQQSKISIDLHAYLSYRGHKLRILTNEEDPDFRVSVLLNF